MDRSADVEDALFPRMLGGVATVVAAFGTLFVAWWALATGHGMVELAISAVGIAAVAFVPGVVRRLRLRKGGTRALARGVLATERALALPLIVIFGLLASLSLMALTSTVPSAELATRENSLLTGLSLGLAACLAVVLLLPLAVGSLRRARVLMVSAVGLLVLGLAAPLLWDWSHDQDGSATSAAGALALDAALGVALVGGAEAIRARRVTSMAFDARGDLVVAGSKGLARVALPEGLRTPLVPGAGPIRIAGDGRLVHQDVKGDAVFRDTADFAEVGRVAGLRERLVDGEVSPDGRHLAVLDGAGTILVDEREVGRRVLDVRVPFVKPSSIRWAGDGAAVIASSEAGQVERLTLDGERSAFRAEWGPGEYLAGAVVDARARRLVYGSGDLGMARDVVVASIEADRVQPLRRVHFEDRLDRLLLAEDAPRAVALFEDGRACWLDTARAEPLRRFELGRERVTAAAISRDGRRLAIAQGDAISVWEVEGEEPVRLRA